MSENEKLDLILKGMSQINLRLDGMDARFDAMDARFDAVDTRFDAMDKRLDKVEMRLDNIEMRLDKVEMRLDEVETRLGDVEAEVKVMKIILENETNRNIRIVAENHLNLDLKLNMAIKNSEDVMAKQTAQEVYLNLQQAKIKELVNSRYVMNM